LADERKAKNAPKEFHSLKPVGLPKPSILKKKRAEDFVDGNNHFDPRFRNKAVEGKKKARLHHYDPRYGFLEEMLKEELDTFYKEMHREDDAENRSEIKRKIDRHETRLSDIQQNKLKYEIEKDYYQRQAEVIEKTGQKAHMLTKGRLEALVKKRQFDEMRDEGKLEKYLKKKRKRNFAKDVKKMGLGEGRKVKRQKVG